MKSRWWLRGRFKRYLSDSVYARQGFYTGYELEHWQVGVFLYGISIKADMDWFGLPNAIRRKMINGKKKKNKLLSELGQGS